MFLIVAAHLGQMTRKHKFLPFCLLWECGARRVHYFNKNPPTVTPTPN